MSEEVEIQEDDLPVQDELATLKARADLLGISYHPSIGVDKLRDKINDHLADTPKEPVPTQAAEVATAPKTKVNKRREASELVRVNVTCMNPNKREWQGEIFTAGNSVVGTFKKFVAFNTPDGFHIPRIILKQMQERQCQIFYTDKDERGNRVRKGKLIKEFSIEILPKLTEKELKDLAQRQAMARGA